MQLRQLVSSAPRDAEISGITSDSREARPGFLFAAFPGSKQDGRAFIDAAIKAGAVAILAPRGTVLPDSKAILIESDNPRRDFAKIAAVYYGQQPKMIAAVTGTNGKSSAVNLCRQMWQSMDHAAASLGTLGITANLKNGGIDRPGTLTTPDPVTLHSELAELDAAGVTHLAMEASSQGLDQYRLDGVRVTVAAFTNLSRDHLDYHGTMTAYLEAKKRLFTEILSAQGVAVLNCDIPEFAMLEKTCKERGIRVISFGEKAKDIRLIAHKPLTDGQFISLEVFGEKYDLELPLVGKYQVENALAALGMVIAEDPDNRLLHMQAVYALEKLQPVRGRLELAGKLPNGAAVYVDYAHTPDGIETMLESLPVAARRRNSKLTRPG